MAEVPNLVKAAFDMCGPVSWEEWDQTQKKLAQALKATERVEGIVYVCSLDDGLELLLKTAMIDDESVDELMKDGQALQSFSSKLKLAYALGLLPKERQRRPPLPEQDPQLLRP